MVFSSFVFLLIFLPLVLVVYHIVPKKAKNYVLLVFSLVFYAWGEHLYVFLMIASILIAYFAGLFVHKYLKSNRIKLARTITIASTVFYVGMLLFFKIAYKFQWLPLPIGVSFFTFQIMSYVIDVYRKDTKVQKNPFYLGTYVSLFPQLIAGPIVRYRTIAEDMEEREENSDKFAEGINRFIIGLGKKVLLANNIGFIFNQVQAMDYADISVATAWISALAYGFQIYFDFSGYSDMAIGIGKMFGFTFLENFNYPYVSRSITEFWRRWHISLSSWFRDYVYIPLGGNRCSKSRHYFNMFVVWALTGLWHGFGWNFIAWGLYYFILLVIEKTFLLKWLEKIPRFFQHVYALFFINFGWVLFSIEDSGKLIQYIKIMFGLGGARLVDDTAVYYMAGYGVLLIIAAVASTPVLIWIKDKLQEIIINENVKTAVFEIIAPIATWIVLIVSIAYLAGESFNPFLYFRF